MSDLRYDPISNQWIAIANNRHERPIEVMPVEQQRPQLLCPFCKGNEDETPPPIAVYRSDGEPLTEDDDISSWTVRVVPNKYPSLPHATANGSVAAKPCCRDFGPYRSTSLPGEQELVIPTPRHVMSLSELDENELKLSFRAYQHRLRYQQALPHVKHSMLFMNCRSSAGASLSHIHSQIIASPVVSDYLAERVRRNQHHHDETGVTIMESIVQWERIQRKRVVYESECFCVFCPFASRLPYQLWIVPKHEFRRFMDCPDWMRDELAWLCQQMICRIERMLEEPGYNLLLHQAPYEMADTDHWYFELFPRLTRAAGFEWGTDIWVNPITPENAARRFRL